MLYSIRETDAEANLSSDSYTARKSLNSDLQKKSYSRSLPRQQQNLDQEIQKLNDIIVQLRKVEQLLINQVQDLKIELEEQFKNSNRNQKYIDELNKELQQMSDKLHSEIMHNGQLQKINIELKKSILKLEQEVITTNKLHQDISEELQILKSKYSHEHKFIESLLQMVISCHPDNSFREQPSLKQTWKWLKLILADYMTLKQQSRNFQENSGQSSSSTNK
ncbi:unnamed protein product [Paramecium pentaurelia]|uniref:Uncharacterized protein n=1 Tax=Paramecium pentaurelia TaxID=43138 RepID=A0A8S1UMU2_9CILI|nr:unnamed protein product [Paramecium pentaurelia]